MAGEGIREYLDEEEKRHFDEDRSLVAKEGLFFVTRQRENETSNRSLLETDGRGIVT